MHTPLFSVIIPAHDRRALATRAVDSVLASAAMGRVQVIVVDDASTDATSQALHERFGDDSRVQILRSEINQGPSGARNRGLMAATGEFVIFLDSDDVLLPSALAFALAAFRRIPQMQFMTLEGEAQALDQQALQPWIIHEWNPGWRTAGRAALPLQACLVDPPDCTVSRPHVLEFGDLSSAILFGDLFFLSGVVIRRSIAFAAGMFDERYRYLEDWHFMARVCLLGIGGYLDHVGFHRETGRHDQLSNAGTPLLTALMHQRILAVVRATRRHWGESQRQLLGRAQALADYRLGRCLLEQRHPRLARPYLLRALLGAHKPVKTMAWIAGGGQMASVSRYLSGHRLLH